MLSLILTVILSYIIGSIPSGLILGKGLWNTDLREHGSHNIGATNAWRTLGKVPGTMIFLLDFLKGAAGALLGSALVGTPLAIVLGGIFAILGHSRSIFLRFQGGKGVATGLGVIAMIMPAITAIVFIVWLAIVFATRYVSLGSIVGAALVPILALITGQPAVYTLFGVFAAALIIIRHQSNIQRLLNGTESKIKAGRR